MGREDVVAGRAKQAKGKAREIAGAVTGNTKEQVKGKIEKNVGKAQAEAGKRTK